MYGFSYGPFPLWRCIILRSDARIGTPYGTRPEDCQSTVDTLNMGSSAAAGEVLPWRLGHCQRCPL